jgi:pullulanase
LFKKRRKIMYETFGPVVTGNTVEFRLFFPDNTRDPSQYTRGGSPRIQRIQIAGDFQTRIGGNNWDYRNAPEMVRNEHPNGWLYAYEIPELPEGFYHYKFFVTFEDGTTRWCGDPCARHSVGADENAGFIIGGDTTTVNSIPNRLPQKDLVLYELMIDDFTRGYRGDTVPIDAVGDRIDYLEDLGINTVAFMPFTAWPGAGFSWGYDPFLFFSVENQYVHDDSEPLNKLYKLKTLINELHRRNIGVIMDGVFNHVTRGPSPGSGFPYYWLYLNPADSPFIGRFSGGLFFEDLDFNNNCVQQFIFDVCSYWLDEYQLDGIRFDYSLGFYREGDYEHGITRLIRELRNHLEQTGRSNISLNIEHLTDDRYQAINDTNLICATGCWFDQFLLECFNFLRSQNIDPRILRILNSNLDFAPGKGPITYIENHDHATFVNVAGGRSMWWKMQPYAIALLTSPGAVIIHNGQEFGDDNYMPESGPDRVQSRPLNWQYSTDYAGETLRNLYRRLIFIRKNYPALRSANFYPWPYDYSQVNFNAEGYGIDTDRDVVIYQRWGNALDGQTERFIIVINFSNADQFVDIPFPSNGNWEDLLNGTASNVQQNRIYNQRINSNWGRIYYRKG